MPQSHRMGSRLDPHEPCSVTPGLFVECFSPYGSPVQPPVLPIPAGLQPTYIAAAPGVDYVDAAHSHLYALTGGAPTTYFGLRFSGARQQLMPKSVRRVSAIGSLSSTRIRVRSDLDCSNAAQVELHVLQPTSI